MNTKHNFQSAVVICLCALLSLSLNGQTGVYTVQGNLALNTTTYIGIQNTSGPGSGHGQLVVNGDVSIDGTLNITLDGYVPANNHQFEIISYSGAISGSYNNIIWPPTMAGWNIDYGIINPSKVTIYGPNSPLPIELISFYGEVFRNENRLYWETATEINNDYFEVTHSTDGSVFRVLDKIPSHFNHSSTPQVYSYTDRNVPSGMSYYRLRQVDLDGKYTLSKIISIFNEGDKQALQVFPNPSHGEVSFSPHVHYIEIFDLVGNKVYEGDISSQKISLSHLNPGFYTMTFNNSSKSTPFLLLKQ